MSEILEKLEAARAEVARLEREVAGAPCRQVGHRWKFFGGTNCGCYPGSGCSIAVHKCEVCGDYDYGDHPQADEQRQACADEMKDWDALNREPGQ